jgi:hypothetical protein
MKKEKGERKQEKGKRNKVKGILIIKILMKNDKLFLKGR